MKTLRECYDTLSPNDAESLREAFKRWFKCSKNTFYRVLNNPNPELVHLSFLYNEAGLRTILAKSSTVLNLKY